MSKKNPPIPRFLQNVQSANGRASKGHAPRSIVFKHCHNEGELREFQIVSIDPIRGISVFRCVICDFRVEVTQDDSA